MADDGQDPIGWAGVPKSQEQRDERGLLKGCECPSCESGSNHCWDFQMRMLLLPQREDRVHNETEAGEPEVDSVTGPELQPGQELKTQPEQETAPGPHHELHPPVPEGDVFDVPDPLADFDFDSFLAMDTGVVLDDPTEVRLVDYPLAIPGSEDSQKMEDPFKFAPFGFADGDFFANFEFDASLNTDGLPERDNPPYEGKEEEHRIDRSGTPAPTSSDGGSARKNATWLATETYHGETRSDWPADLRRDEETGRIIGCSCPACTGGWNGYFEYPLHLLLLELQNKRDIASVSDDPSEWAHYQSLLDGFRKWDDGPKAVLEHRKRQSDATYKTRYNVPSLTVLPGMPVAEVSNCEDIGSVLPAHREKQSVTWAADAPFRSLTPRPLEGFGEKPTDQKTWTKYENHDSAKQHSWRPGGVSKKREGRSSRCRRRVLANVLLALLGVISLSLWYHPAMRLHSAVSSARGETLSAGTNYYPYNLDSRSLPLNPVASRLQAFQNCSLHSLLAGNLSFLYTAHPLPVSEFVTRRTRLADALWRDEVDAFIVEPGYTFSYYANITQKDWEVWEPEERPFLMVVQALSPELMSKHATVETTFLVPSFEAERARLLGMPFEQPINVVTYEEHENPYQSLLTSDVFAHLWRARDRAPKVMVDEEMRDFISRGLADSGFSVLGLGGEVERVRQTKTEQEISILRAVNTGTVEAVRAMRRCMVPGLTEDDVQSVLDNTLRAAGLDPFFDIVLFDEDASNPHGGTDGSKKLERHTFVLIDVGAHLYGYSSDICRTFFPPFLERPETASHLTTWPRVVQEKIEVWDIVFEAQTRSLEAMHENATAASVDLAARGVIESAGYGKAFTHRVGHGIGIKAHESPYLHKGNNATLKAGMTFTSEPGVYLVNKFGVRHEDVLLVNHGGLPEILSGTRARGPWDP